jgi:NAD(P) transhydrogenase subunit alpha
MMTTAAGSIPPAKVLVLGAGVAGLQAIATANRLGAVVEAFDVRSEVKEEVESLGATFIEVEGAREAEAGGYAVEQTKEFKKKQQKMVQEHAKKSNVIITTAQIPGKKAPVLVKKETVEAMQPGSVIVDLAASTGGNCELTKEDDTIDHNGVTIIGNSNLPATLSLDASRLFSKNINNLRKEFMEEGEFKIDLEDDIIKGCCVVHQGEIVNEDLKEALNKKIKS